MTIAFRKAPPGAKLVSTRHQWVRAMSALQQAEAEVARLREVLEGMEKFIDRDERDGALPD